MDLSINNRDFCWHRRPLSNDSISFPKGDLDKSVRQMKNARVDKAFIKQDENSHESPDLSEYFHYKSSRGKPSDVLTSKMKRKEE